MTNSAAYALWIAWKRGPGNDRMLDRLIEAHAAIAVKLGTDYLRRCPRWVSADDVYQAARVGLWQAARSWDPERGSFAAHAWRRVSGAILDEARVSQWFGRTVLERPASLDVPAAEDAFLADLIIDTVEPVEDQVMAREMFADASVAIGRLPDRQRVALVASMGRYGDTKRAADRLGVHQSRMTQLARQARATIAAELAA